jgi:hypothetical protein
MTSRETPTATPSESAISDQVLGQLSHLERADLLKRLQELTGSEFALSRHLRTARRWFTGFLALCCVALIPWTIGLGLSLPRTYVAANWKILWTGFDVVLLSCLSVTAWSLWKQRQVLVPASIITSVLLLCDAWFDLLTAHGHRQFVLSAVTALFGELPLAAMLCLVSIRALRMTGRAARGLEQRAPVSPLWRTPLITTPIPPIHAPVEPVSPHAASTPARSTS